MNPFLYRLNGVCELGEVLEGGRFKHDVLRKFHLGHLCDDLVTQDDAVVSGCEVDGELFLLIVPKVPPNNATPTHSNFDSTKRDGVNSQEWLAHPDGSVEIGWVKDDLPGPDVLFRNSGIRGLEQLDASNQKWLVPVGRSSQGRETFDRDFVFDLENGNSVIQQRSRSGDRLFEIATEIYDLFHLEETPDDFRQRLFILCTEALAHNYRLSPLEVNAFARMGRPIFSSDTIDFFANCVTDWDLFQEYQKKTEEEKKTEAA